MNDQTDPQAGTRRRDVLVGGAVLAAAGSSSEAAGSTGGPTAETDAGRVHGYYDGAIAVFKGIPYGAPTSGPNRFRAPQPVTPWAGVREAVSFGDQAPQFPFPQRSIYNSWLVPTGESEDCLRLNVWTPALRDGRKRPVMVWIHGGVFSLLSASFLGYDGARLSERGDVVVVTVNHRLNIFGYLDLGDIGGDRFAGSGNNGQLDLIAALEWVRANAEAFGGDPANVTLFGQSGGGAKICALTAMPRASGLFHKAIIQSGPLMRGVKRDVADALARDVLKYLDVPTTDIARIQSLPAAKVLEAHNAMAAQGRSISFAPVVDGVTLPRDPFDPDASPTSAAIPMIIGSNLDEGTVFGTPEDFRLDWPAVPRRLTELIGLPDASAVVTRYRALRPDASASDVFFNIAGEFFMRANTSRIAERKSAQKAAPVYLYAVDWKSPVEGGRWGAPHGVEIPFVFDTVRYSASMVGAGPAPQAMADVMSATWVAFARHGDPNNPRLPHWRPFDTVDRPTMVFDTVTKLVDDPAAAERRFFEELPAFNMAG